MHTPTHRVAAHRDLSAIRSRTARLLLTAYSATARIAAFGAFTFVLIATTRQECGAQASSADGWASANERGDLTFRAQSPEYQSVLKKAVTEFNQGHWPEAKAFFVRAHKLHPSARTLRGLALTSYELRIYVDALTYFEQAIASPELPLTDDMRSQARAGVEECKTFITYEPVSVIPRTARVRVDGQPAVVDNRGRLMLDPGEHELVVEAAGFAPWSREVSATGGELGTLTVELSHASRHEFTTEAPATLETDALAPSLGDLTTPRIVGIGLAAAGVVGLGAGSVFSITAANQNAASRPRCIKNLCDAEGLARRHSALTNADRATVSFVAAGVLVAAGLVTYLFAPAPERPTASRPRLGPVIGPGVAGLSWEGRL